jgi:hypothetical protein
MTTGLRVETPINTTVDIGTLFVAVFLTVDCWYQQHGLALLRGKRGRKPDLSDTEVITLLLMRDFLPFPSERQYLAFIRANYRDWFPQLVDRSQFNRRARNLRTLVEQLRRHWLDQLGATLAQEFLLDTKPVPVITYKRSKKQSEFAGHAGYGVCPSRSMKYFGFKLVALTTLDGIPVAYELVPANTDERAAAEEVLAYVWNSDIFGDKGFIGEEWQLDQQDWHGNRIWTTKRVNQTQQNHPDFDRWLNSKRQRIEGAFNEVQNVGRDIERLLVKTMSGLCTQAEGSRFIGVTAKMASHTLKTVLRCLFNIDVLSFSYIN